MRPRTPEEVDTLIQLARTFCELRAAHREALEDGNLSAEENAIIEHRLAGLDCRIERLKGNNEVERQRGGKVSNVISLSRFKQKAAK